MERPGSAEEVAALLASGRRARAVGGGTKIDWGFPPTPPTSPAGAELQISTAELDSIEHNEGDLTAVLAAGVPVSHAQAIFEKKGQRLCLDPPDAQARATIGGMVATGDSGPLRHRFGAVRDLILGVRVALPDGTVARAGSKVIKNVAGYDVAKLMCGALGTLGVVCEVTLRLHPRPREHTTAVGRSADAGALARAARGLAAEPLELESLDIAFDNARGEGAVLARAAGHAAPQSAAAAAAVMRAGGLETETVEEDEQLWDRQRDGQRAAPGDAVARVSALPSALEQVLAAAPSAVVRAGLGLAWVRLPAEPLALAELRERVAPAPCVLEDAPEAMRGAVDPWGVPPGPELELMRRVKARFDPDGVCNAGRYVGGI
jgi:glycolate oxidase FAD binding subunit